MDKSLDKSWATIFQPSEVFLVRTKTLERDPKLFQKESRNDRMSLCDCELDILDIIEKTELSAVPQEKVCRGGKSAIPSNF